MRRKLSVTIRLPRSRRLGLLLAAVLTVALILGLSAAVRSLSGYKAELRLPAGVPAQAAAKAPASALPPPEALLILVPAAAPASSPPKAVIYCTHTSEEYLGQSRQKGVAGGVLAAARSLAEALEAEGVGVLLDESVHDKDYDEAYADALAALETTAAEHPEISLYIDVHRDSAIAGISTTLEASGETYAKMLLIVGSDEQLPHENWQQNYDFARRVAAEANRLLPGVMREPRVYSGRYNQHIGSQALLVEIGSTDNTQEEAERSARVLARAIAACI